MSEWHFARNTRTQSLGDTYVLLVLRVELLQAVFIHLVVVFLSVFPGKDPKKEKEEKYVYYLFDELGGYHDQSTKFE